MKTFVLPRPAMTLAEKLEEEERLATAEDEQRARVEASLKRAAMDAEAMRRYAEHRKACRDTSPGTRAPPLGEIRSKKVTP